MLKRRVRRINPLSSWLILGAETGVYNVSNFLHITQITVGHVCPEDPHCELYRHKDLSLALSPPLRKSGDLACRIVSCLSTLLPLCNSSLSSILLFLLRPILSLSLRVPEKKEPLSSFPRATVSREKESE